MKECLALASIAFIFCPWAVGCADLLMWAFSGAPLTSIPWRDVRGFVLLIWPIFWLIVVGLVTR